MSRVLVVGTGGVGGGFGAALCDAGHEVVFMARGANLEALRANGLHVTGARGELRIESVDATASPSGHFDLMFLTVKCYDVASVCASIDATSDLVLTMQNGVDAPRIVQEQLGDVALAGTTGIIADLVKPGHVHVVSDYARISFGEVGGGGLTPRVKRLEEMLCASCWIQVDPQADVRVQLWSKLSLICAMGGLTSLYDTTVGGILSDPERREMWSSAIGETLDVARSVGVDLPDDSHAERMDYSSRIDPHATSSMSRDMNRGKPTELEFLNGAVVRIGATHGVKTPVNEEIVSGCLARIASSSTSKASKSVTDH